MLSIRCHFGSHTFLLRAIIVHICCLLPSSVKLDRPIPIRSMLFFREEARGLRLQSKVLRSGHVVKKGALFKVLGQLRVLLELYAKFGWDSASPHSLLFCRATNHEISSSLIFKAFLGDELWAFIVELFRFAEHLLVRREVVWSVFGRLCGSVPVQTYRIRHLVLVFQNRLGDGQRLVFIGCYKGYIASSVLRGNGREGWLRRVLIMPSTHLLIGAWTLVLLSLDLWVSFLEIHLALH